MHRLSLLSGFPSTRRPWLGLPFGFSPRSHCLRLTKGFSRAQKYLTSSGTPGFGILSEIIAASQKSRENSAWISFLFFFFSQKISLRKKNQPFSPPAPAILLSPQLASPWGLLPGSWAPGKHWLYVCTAAWIRCRYPCWLGPSESWNPRKYSSISVAPCPA